MKNLINILLISITIFFTSCGIFAKRVNFSNKELEWFNVYNVNDTLVFQSLTSKKKDTSIIISKKLYHRFDWIRDEYRVHCMHLDYINSKYNYLDYEKKSEEMISNCKTSPEDLFYMGFSYLRSNFKLDDNTKIKDSITLSISKKSFMDVYELTYKRVEFYNGTNDDPEVLYFDKKYGIVKYITFHGEIWERINWNRAKKQE